MITTTKDQYSELAITGYVNQVIGKEDCNAVTTIYTCLKSNSSLDGTQLLTI